MKKDNIPIPVSTVILMVVTITYKLVLVVIGGAILLLRPDRVMFFLKPVLPWCYLGIALNIFCVTLMCMLVFHPSMAERLLLLLLSLAKRLHLVKRAEEKRESLKQAMQVYEETAAYLAVHWKIVVYAFLITVVQRFSLFFVTSLTYLAFQKSGESLFKPIFGEGLTIPAMIVSRGISYYGQLIISALLTIYANFRIGRKQKRQSE